MSNTNRDWLPTTRPLVLAMAKAWLGQLADFASDWGVPAASVTALGTLTTAFEEALEKVADTAHRTHVDVVACDAAYKLLKDTMRDTKKRWFHMPPVTIEQWAALLLPIPDETESAEGNPTTRPQLTLVPALREVTVHFRDQGSEKRGKPAGVKAIRMKWALLDHPPAELEELIHTAEDSASPYTFTFKESERGKSFYICACWINNTFQEGPYSAIAMVDIP